LWAASYDGGTPGDDFARAVAVSPSGSTVFVTGQSENSAGEANDATVAYDAATGGQLWSALYPGRGQGNAAAGAIVASPDGATVYVTGTSDLNSGFPQVTTVAYDAATGATRWVASYLGDGSATATSIAVSPDGTHLFVAGQTSTARYRAVRHFLTLGYDAGSGRLLWGRQHRWPGRMDSTANAVTVSPDGGTVYAAGYRTAAGGVEEFVTAAYRAAAGAARWLRTAPAGAGNAVADSAVVSPDGSAVYVTGQSGSGSAVTTVAYAAATGTRRWSAHFAASRYAGPAAVSPDGSALYVAGRGAGPEGIWGDFTAVAYRTASGTRAWAAHYASSGPNTETRPTALALSPDGSTVYLAGGGSTLAGGVPGFLTVAFGATTGTRRWAAYASGTNWPASIAVSRAGSVFVTGQGVQTGPDFVYRTVAYQG
jgi:sugar lactone lactonase YvrE